MAPACICFSNVGGTKWFRVCVCVCVCLSAGAWIIVGLCRQYTLLFSFSEEELFSAADAVCSTKHFMMLAFCCNEHLVSMTRRDWWTTQREMMCFQYFKWSVMRTWTWNQIFLFASLLIVVENCRHWCHRPKYTPTRLLPHTITLWIVGIATCLFCPKPSYPQVNIVPVLKLGPLMCNEYRRWFRPLWEKRRLWSYDLTAL